MSGEGDKSKKGFLRGLISRRGEDAALQESGVSASGEEGAGGAGRRDAAGLVLDLLTTPVDWSLSPLSFGREMKELLDCLLGGADVSLLLVRERLDPLLVESCAVPARKLVEEAGHGKNCPVATGEPVYTERHGPETACVVCRPKCEIGRPMLRLPLDSGGCPPGVLTFCFSEPPEPVRDSDFTRALAARLSTEFRAFLLSESNRQLEISDHLTRVYNYRYFMQFLGMELERSRRYDHSFSLLLFDIKDFREFNERYGREAGDAMLLALGRLLRSSVRATDFVARYSGQQFAVVLIETSAEGAAVVRDKIIDSIEEFSLKKQRDGEEMRVSVRCGMSVFPYDATIASRLIMCAEDSLRKAKQER